MSKINSYKDLLIWQKSMILVEDIYRASSKISKNEQWGIISQMRRAAVSIPSNIAEGYGRKATGEYRHFLCISRGSLYELETQVILCLKLGFLEADEVGLIDEKIQEIGKMITALISKMHQ